jgi:hypothetical protein
MGRAGREAQIDRKQSRRSKRRRPTHLATQQRTTFLAKRAVVWSPTGRDDVFLLNVKIAWAESGAQSLMGTHISGDWARTFVGLCARGRLHFSLCADTTQYAADLTPSCERQVTTQHWKRSPTATPGFTNQGIAWWIFTISSL